MTIESKYQFSKNEFKAEIIRRGFSVAQIAKALGINNTSLYRKMDGESDFYRSEIQKLGEVLNLSNEDLLRIFFAVNVA